MAPRCQNSSGCGAGRPRCSALHVHGRDPLAGGPLACRGRASTPPSPRRSRCSSCSIRRPGSCSRASLGRRSRRGLRTARRSPSRGQGGGVLRDRDGKSDEPSRRRPLVAPATWSPLGGGSWSSTWQARPTSSTSSWRIRWCWPATRCPGWWARRRSGHLTCTERRSPSCAPRRPRWAPGSRAWGRRRSRLACWTRRSIRSGSQHRGRSSGSAAAVGAPASWSVLPG